MRFVAVDVETANADMASICSIGLATFEFGRLIDERYLLVDPEDHFDPINVSIHGIDAGAVQGSPNFGSIHAMLDESLQGSIVVTHTHFDRVALHRAASRASLEIPSCSSLDTARVARRTWADCAQRGYGLAPLCKRIGYEFQHHDALEDAKAAGFILMAALVETGRDLDGIMARSDQPITGSAAGGSVSRQGNAEGPLFGEVVVFTGALTLTRREAADLAAVAGCTVTPGVTRTTTLLVVGDTDARNLAGHDKSSKHRKAEQMAMQGHPIKIVGEGDFRRLVAIS